MEHPGLSPRFPGGGDITASGSVDHLHGQALVEQLLVEEVAPVEDLFLAFHPRPVEKIGHVAGVGVGLVGLDGDGAGAGRLEVEDHCPGLDCCW